MAEEEEEEGKYYKDNFSSMDKSCQSGSPASLQDLINGRLSSSLQNLISQSRTIPSGKDFHFYNNFKEFRDPSRLFGAKSQDLLSRVGSVGRRSAGTVPDDLDDGYDWLVSVNDDVVERIGEAMDEFLLPRPGKIGVNSLMEEGGFQMVRGKKNERRSMTNGSDNHVAAGEGVSGVRVATRDKKVDLPKAKVPFHLPHIVRPQDEFSIRVNNTNQPFEHVWLPRSEDGSHFIHPMENLNVVDFIDKNLRENNPVKPLSLEETPFKFVENVKDLKEVASELRNVKEFAIDLEHNQYRSFQGLTCLMQISTRTEDFVIDTLKLRVHIGPYLREVFKDPSKRKVMHGADHDILWLQRDFGIYVCNLFDTGQASRVLQLERKSLEYLLSHYCDVAANKEYQNAEWRLRPLPVEMIKYAREDTHYLLYLYDVMCQELLSVSRDFENETALMEVYRRSCNICLQLYEKELFTNTSFLYIYGLREADFSPQQLAVVSALCEWRDNTARAEDESTGFILPNKTLLEIARHMPDSNNKLRRFIKSKNSFVERYMVSVVHIIKTSILNAYAFEEISEELKRAHRERLADQNSQTVHEEFRTPQTAMSLSSQIPSTSGHLHYTSLLEYGSSAQPIVSSPLSSIGHNMGNESSASLNTNKVNVASIQVLKKPNGPFGALLGNSKKKISDFKNKSTDQEKTEKKLLQIKSSVRLPFHSFSENLDALSIKPILSNENPPPPELQQHDTDRDIGIGSNLDDIIPLKSDESENDSIGEQKQLSPPQPEILDLSTTCHGTPELSLAQEKTNNVPFEPFDYEAARKEMNLEEELASEKKNDDSINNGNRLKGGSRKFKQTRVIGKGYQEETADFEMPKRRQAFPASGNRSATFPD